jgi:riboflavin biosynthesis pyrimidine reductase
VVAIMVASIDGRTTVDGGSTPLGHPADRALLRELRSRADVLLVGTGTIAAEGYGNLLDDEPRRRRHERGQPDQPLVATVSRTLDLPLSAALFQSPDMAVRVFTNQAATDIIGDVAASVVVETVREGVVDAVTALGSVGGGLIVCEGGPTLLGQLAASDLIDDLLLTVSPVLTGGDGTRLLEGSLVESLKFALVAAHQADQHLFLHYRRGTR